MAGERDLKKLINGMRPELNEDTYVFCSIGNDSTALLNLSLSHFREKEGVTLVLKKEHADANDLVYDFEAAWIQLNVHSNLEAVGLTAAVSEALAQQGISCNVIAGYYHDHLFVPKNLAHQALQALLHLSEKH